VHTKVKLSNGQEIAVEIRTAQEREVSYSQLSSKLSDVLPAISGLSADLMSALEKVKPQKATLEFGLKLEFESSGLLAVLCSTTANADLKIKLEWGNAFQSPE